MNDFLTALAILGLVLFGVVFVLLVVLFVQQALGVTRLFRSGAVKVRFTWGDRPIASPPPWLEPDEPELAERLDPAADAGNAADVKKGWGFD